MALSEFEECIKHGIELTENGDYGKARLYFSDAINMYSTTQKEQNKGFLFIGITYFYEGNYVLACGEFGNILRFEPDNIEARKMLEEIIKYGDMTSRFMAEKYLQEF